MKIKGKHINETRGSEVEIKNYDPTKVFELHKSTSEVINHTMDDQGKENTRIR